MKLLLSLLIVLNCHLAIGQDYTQYNMLLGQHVDLKGRVNYKALSKEKATILRILTDWQKTDLQKLAKPAKLAFLINLYNLETIYAIVQHYPITSIKDISKGRIWDEKRVVLNKKTYSLNEIENQLIRAEFKDARVHFVLNCAARSCPPLAQEAYTASNIEMKLEEKTRTFINNPDYNTFHKNKVVISSIFDWYKVDFGNTIGFINRYRKPVLPANTPIQYHTYDWKLNSQ